VGTAAASLLYPRTWMAHHFGIDEAERGDRARLMDIGREIYSGIMYVLQHMAPLDFFVFYFDSAKPWHDLFFGQFVERYSDGQDLIYDRFTLYKKLLDAPVPDEDADVAMDDPTKLRDLARRLAGSLDPLEREAYAYGEETISLDEFSRSCASQGYERTRTFLFSGDACLVAETGQEGINVFSLFNRCWLAPGNEVESEVKDSLLLQAARHYGSRGKKSMLFVDGPGRAPDQLDHLGFTYVAEGTRWLARRRVVPAYLAFLEELISGMGC
jgi:hypothetical protein